MEDKTGTTTYQYDEMQRLLSTTDSNDKTVSYTYDVLGRKNSITYPDGQLATYEYDIMDRLTTVTDGEEVIAEYEYNKNSQLVENKRDDITTTYEYDELGQIETLTTAKSREEIMQFEYQYDAIGNIVEEVRTEQDTTNTRTYEYDKANQLTSFTDNDYTEAYTYDNVGNMLTKDINGVATNYSYNVGNQLVEEIKENKTISYEYNKNGDLTSKSTGEQYQYDIQGNLTSIVGNDLNKQYTYNGNGNGNRLSETTDGETTYYVNDINQSYEQVLQTYNEDGNTINTYTYGVQRISSEGQADETYLYDGRGSVVGVVGSDNSVVTYAYTAYGDLMPDSPTPEVYGYNAEATDYKTGLQYLRARYYNVEVQRFIQEDDYRGKYNAPASMNRYVYVQSNPVKYSDPSGHKPFEKGPKVVKPRPAGMPSNIVKSSTGAGYTRKSSKASVVKKTKNAVSSTAGIPSNVELNKVKNPYAYGPEWITQDVYNCMKDIDEGDGLKESEDLETIIKNYDILEEIIQDALDYEHNQKIVGENSDVNTSRYLKLGIFLENLKDEDGNIRGTNGIDKLGIFLEEAINDDKENAEIVPYAILNYSPSSVDNTEGMSEESARKTFDKYSEIYDSGVYYEDVAWSVGAFVGGEVGVTFIINLDENYVAQYGHKGVMLCLTAAAGDMKVVTGKVEGLDQADDTIDGYTKWFLFSSGSAFVQGEIATSIGGGSYGSVTQKGNGSELNVGIAGGASYYTYITHYEFDSQNNK